MTMNGTGVALQVPEKIVAEIIQNQVATQVAQALGSRDELITKMVSAALQMTVNERGEPCTYSSARPYIDHICMDAIRKAARDAIVKMVAEQSAKIQAEVEKQIRKSPSAIAKVLVNGLTEAIQSSWRLEVKINDKSN